MHGNDESVAEFNQTQNQKIFFLPLALIVCFPVVYSSKIGTLRSKKGDGHENVS